MSSLDVDRSASHSWSKRGSYPPSTSLTTFLIKEALAQSADKGISLSFMKKGLTDIGAEAAEELAMIRRQSAEDEGGVQRIALGGNRLSTLPQEFGLLSRLRYLNLRGNSFSVFPNVLTLLPSLDILDLSYNKIKRLPSDPGQLVNLKVFSLSRNKITRLPRYFPSFHHLSVLEIARNPIDWPPKSVMDRPTKFTTEDAMIAWIHSVQRWIELEVTRSPPRSIDDSGYTDNLESTLEDSFNSWSRFGLSENEFDAGVTPHARSFSIDSVSSVAESDLETPSSSYGQLEKPPPLHLGILQSSYSTETSPTHSLESYLPSPADSDVFDNNVTLSGREQQQQQHARNASYAHGTASRSTNLANLPGKKSMPDLRTAKLNFSKKVPDLPERGTTTTNFGRVSRPNDEFSMPSPLSLRQDSGSSAGSHSRPTKYTKEHAPPSTQPSPTRAVPSMAFERNSYFHRLSTLPTSAKSTLTEPLLCLIDSARSLLFAVCQIYQALEHYTIHAIDERLSSVLRKVLDPASAEMMQLINALDRFDSMSRKVLPPPPVCRAVVEGCKDTVAAFGKAVNVLALQLKVIAAGDDVRYLRSMLLLLYGASAEISCAWQKMILQVEAIKPLLHAKPFPTPSPTAGTLTGLNASEQPTPASGNASSFPWEQPPPLASLRTSSNGRTHTARRHAGSFSSKDVELGKKMPSYDEPPPFSRSTLRRHPTNTSTTIVTPQPPSPMPTSTSAAADSSVANHSRSGSQVSLQASSSSSSPSVPYKAPYLDLPSTSKVQVDKEALHAIQEAVDVAPIVWGMMEDTLADVLDTKPDVRETLERARTVTKRLSEMTRAMQEGDFVFDKKALREDAHMFLKTVVQLSNVIKSYNDVHSSALRMNMVKLTNSTEEFAILLHVSSFSPAVTPRPFSPMYSAFASQSQISLLGPPTPDENRLTSSLSRSRSAQAATTTPSKAGLPQPEPPRSALPMQSFKLPAIRRLQVDGNDPTG